MGVRSKWHALQGCASFQEVINMHEMLGVSEEEPYSALEAMGGGYVDAGGRGSRCWQQHLRLAAPSVAKNKDVVYVTAASIEEVVSKEVEWIARYANRQRLHQHPPSQQDLFMARDAMEVGRGGKHG